MTTEKENYRALESGIHTDLKDRLSYGKYLHLSQILSAQHMRSDEHDEMLFVIIHQASELWMKLAGHELDAAIRYLKANDHRKAFKVIARVKLILEQLKQSWSILATMTPVDYLKFRDTLGPASGFQSYGYRKMEFLLGNKNKRLVTIHRHNAEVHGRLEKILHEPSLYDVAIGKLVEAGFDIDPSHLQRDVSEPYAPNASVQAAWHSVYTNSEKYFELYELAEKLVDIEDAFQNWRFKHMYTVQRIIGLRHGTGGSSGVPFLRRALDISFFPELFALRADL